MASEYPTTASAESAKYGSGIIFKKHRQSQTVPANRMLTMIVLFALMLTLILFSLIMDLRRFLYECIVQYPERRAYPNRFTAPGASMSAQKPGPPLSENPPIWLFLSRRSPVACRQLLRLMPTVRITCSTCRAVASSPSWLATIMSAYFAYSGSRWQ